MTIKRNTIAQPAAYENKLDRDPKSKTFGQKLHYPLHADGTVSGQGYRKASDALSAHRMMVQKADELAHTEGYSAHDEGLDILSNPYSGRLARAWAEGWNKADADGVVELGGQQESDTADGDDATDRDLVGDVNPVVDEAQV